MISAMPQGISGAHHSRRAVLSGCGLVLAGALAGCDIRVERDTPHIPGGPTQSPPPDTKALRAALRRLRTLATTAESAGRAPATSSAPSSSTPPSTSPSGGASSKTSSAEPTSDPKTIAWAAQLATIHHQQATRVAGIIATSGATAPPSNPAVMPTGTVRRLRTLEVRGVDPAALDRLAGLSTANLPMLCAIAATQGAGASMLGAELTWPAAQLPAGSATLAVLSSVRSCVYALEVVAGRTPLKQRTLIRSTLATMYAARSRLVAAAGSSAPPPPVDYQLPVHVTDTASGHHLARLMLGRVVTACAAQSVHSVGDAARISAIVRLWTEATAASWQWGTVPSAFPGLKE